MIMALLHTGRNVACRVDIKVFGTAERQLYHFLSCHPSQGLQFLKRKKNAPLEAYSFHQEYLYFRRASSSREANRK